MTVWDILADIELQKNKLEQQMPVSNKWDMYILLGPEEHAQVIEFCHRYAPPQDGGLMPPSVEMLSGLRVVECKRSIVKVVTNMEKK